ncbi:MAG: thiamine diphosphokinase [Clostridiales bacterium]|nr:thiamine diphosphokinase [Clostridiales bacterium]
MRAVVIGNGTIKSYSRIKKRIRPDDFIICADGGLRHARMLGVTPDIAIGDFDSSEKDENIKSCVYPVRKDFTDGELAVNYAIDNGYDEIMLLGMTGDRLDHTLTDILLLSKHEGAYLVDDKNEIHIVRSELRLTGCRGKTLSIIPIYGDMTGVSTTGLEWQLNNETLFFAQSRGNSNVVTEDVCTVSVRSGMGVVAVNDGE